MKKLKITFGLIALAAFFACNNNNKPNPADAVKSISLKFTELGRETQFRITCDKFDYYFGESKVRVLDKKPAIDSLMQQLTDMKPAEEGTQPDIRGRIVITHANNVADTLCVGVKSLTYRGVTYETPQGLLAIIQK